MNPDHLLELAERMARIEIGNPRQTSLKRAISTAYYALFHALSQMCVDQTVGSTFRSTRYWQVVTPLYRAVDHGPAKKLFERLAKAKDTPDLLRLVSGNFVELQTARVAADYDPGRRYRREDALDVVRQAREAIEALRALPREDLLPLAVQLIAKPR